MLTPSQVAKRANVTPQSIRNYSSEFADLLSPGASVENGPRLYTDEDVKTLCAIAELRKAKIPFNEIVERLQSDIPTIVDVDSNEPIKDPQEPLKTAPETTFAIQMVLPGINARFEAIERQIVEQRQERHDRLTIIGLSFIAGMVAAMVIFLAAYLLTSFR